MGCAGASAVTFGFYQWNWIVDMCLLHLLYSSSLPVQVLMKSYHTVEVLYTMHLLLCRPFLWRNEIKLLLRRTMEVSVFSKAELLTGFPSRKIDIEGDGNRMESGGLYL